MKFDIPNWISFFFSEFSFDEGMYGYKSWDNGKKGILKNDLEMLRG